MPTNRISQYLLELETPPAFYPMTAFTVWPTAFLLVSAPQQAFVAEVYRRAQELTEAQIRQKNQRPRVAYSLN